MIITFCIEETTGLISSFIVVEVSRAPETLDTFTLFRT